MIQHSLIILDPYLNYLLSPKIIEKAVAKQVLELVKVKNILDPFQSGFRPLHSTETALLKVTNDILMNADSGHHSILVLLDLSAAFDTVDHTSLLDRLKHWVGIDGTALKWFSSYLTDLLQLDLLG